MNPWHIPRSISLKAIYTKKIASTRRKQDEEELYIGTAESEHIEMYLKALWYIVEKGEEPKISRLPNYSTLDNHLSSKCFASETKPTW